VFRLLIVVSALVAVVAAAPADARCKHERYDVVGSVIDSAGRPVAGARVFVLLDKISEKKFNAQGMRARSTRTDKNGRFHSAVVCGTQPDPCARKPKHVTIAAGQAMSLRLMVYKLATLGETETPTSCFVEVPALILNSGF
jgi:hypothetical protein